MHNSHLERLEHFTRRLCRANIIRSPISDNYGVNWEFLMVGIPVSSFVCVHRDFCRRRNSRRKLNSFLAYNADDSFVYANWKDFKFLS